MHIPFYIILFIVTVSELSMVHSFPSKNSKNSKNFNNPKNSTLTEIISLQPPVSKDR